MGKGFSKFKKALPPAGEIRRSQIVGTFGAGAMVDLTQKSVLIRGLDHWRYPRPKAGVPYNDPVIKEPRLRDLLAERLKGLGIELDAEAPFREPPAGDADAPSPGRGIGVIEFPTWFVCQNSKCRALNRPSWLKVKEGRYFHADCDRKRDWECVPVRFVATCRRGHLADFPWVPYAHRKLGQTCTSPALVLLESGTGDFSEIRVKCLNCDASEALAAALNDQANFMCEGCRPWLGREGQEECEERIRLLVRTATNAYFSQVVSALSIPEPERKLEQRVTEAMPFIEHATAAALPVLRSSLPQLKPLEGFSDEEILSTLARIKSSDTATREPLRTAEYRHFLDQPAETRGELPDRRTTFWARGIQPDSILLRHVDRVVLAHKLREVRVQVGFTRSEPASPDLEGEFDLGVQTALVGLKTNWLPAHEVRGEGVFFTLNPGRVLEWENRTAVRERAIELKAGHDAALAGAQLDFPGARFYLLHSLAHLLITAISLECGYTASAIRERIYCAPADRDLPMAGILLSTGSSGSEGTLGGLVEQGRSLHVHLLRALNLAGLCSNDPVCASHHPNDRSERFLEGAACHGCLYIAEPSCERSNRFLDRALVVPTLGRDPALAYFVALARST